MSKVTAIFRPAATIRWAPPIVAFLATVAVLALLNREPQADPVAALGPSVPAEGLAVTTAKSITALEGAVRGDSESAPAYASLGDSYLQAARETANPDYLDRAEGAFGAALRRDPDSALATIGQGTVALAHHDFAAGLELGRAAHRLEPGLVRPYAVMADALVELGRYGAAARTLDRMVQLKPTLAAYSRISYFRELQGDLDGAVEAMRLAVSAGGGSVEGTAYVQHLLGKLEVARGRFGAAERAFRSGLALDPAYAPAIAGVARVATARGDFDAAIRGYRRAVAGLPNAENATALADALRAAGHGHAAERAYDRAIAIARTDPVEINQELALLESDHGSRARGLAVAREAWRQAPGVKSAEALAWALHRTGGSARAVGLARRAVALSPADASLRYRAGRIALGAGEPALAQRFLERALTINPRFHPVEAPHARRLLAGLGEPG